MDPDNIEKKQTGIQYKKAKNITLEVYSHKCDLLLEKKQTYENLKKQYQEINVEQNKTTCFEECVKQFGRKRKTQELKEVLHRCLT